MEPAVQHTTRWHRPAMPWGLLTGLEVVALAVISGGLILDVFPSVFDVEWGCGGTSGEMHTAADTYVAAFAVGGALGWLAAAAVTAVLHAAGRRWLALLTPLAWFGVLVLVALAIASSIGPLTCG